MVVSTVPKRTTNARRIAPHHLREVAPRIVIVRVVVRVLGLLLVPAMGGGARELDPRIVGRGRRARGGQVAAGTLLLHMSRLIHT
jgi:hypothetical protein